MFRSCAYEATLPHRSVRQAHQVRSRVTITREGSCWAVPPSSGRGEIAARRHRPAPTTDGDAADCGGRMRSGKDPLLARSRHGFWCGAWHRDVPFRAQMRVSAQSRDGFGAVPGTRIAPEGPARAARPGAGGWLACADETFRDPQRVAHAVWEARRRALRALRSRARRTGDARRGRCLRRSGYRCRLRGDGAGRPGGRRSDPLTPGSDRGRAEPGKSDPRP